MLRAVARYGDEDDAKRIARTTLDAEAIDVEDAYLAGADVPYAWMRRANFNNIDASGIDLTGATLTGSVFNEARLSMSRFEGAVLEEVRFDGADLTFCSLRGAEATGATFRKAKLGGADFERADLTRADLTDADFTLPESTRRHGTIEAARTLHQASLRGARGLTLPQRRACLDKGAVWIEAADSPVVSSSLRRSSGL